MNNLIALNHNNSLVNKRRKIRSWDEYKVDELSKNNNTPKFLKSDICEIFCNFMEKVI